MSDPRDNEEKVPLFDVVFQMGILKLALTDDFFCLQLVKYLAEDNDLNEYSLFETKQLHEIFKLIANSVKEFGTRPTDGQIRQNFFNLKAGDKEDYLDLYESILNQDTRNEAFYRKFLTAFIQEVKFRKGFVKTRDIFKTKGLEAPEYMQSVLDGINRVTFDKDDVVYLRDIPALISEGSTLNSSKIPTGIDLLDKDLVGGLPRENLTVALGGTNVGKSLFCISLSCNALRAVDEEGKDRGFKVLHVNLEGQRDEAMKRYAANLAEIDYSDILKGTFDGAAQKRLKDVIEKFNETRLKVINILGFGITIEDVYAKLKEEYKDFKFDFLVIDYGQLLDVKGKSENNRLAMAKVFRGLDSISKEFSCVLVSPVQATRNAQENQNMSFKGKNNEERGHILRSTDISEAFEIARVAGVILTLNRTEEEGRKNRLRVFLEKQRQGAKDKLYGLIVNYGQSNLITGKFFNPYESVIDNEEAEHQIRQKSQENKNNGLGKIKNLTEQKQSILKEERKQDSPHVEMLENFSLEFYKLSEEYSKIKSYYDELRDQDEPDKKELEDLYNVLGSHRDRIDKILGEARLMVAQAYPNANKELFHQMKSQLDDMKKNGATDVSKIQELEKMIRHLDVGLNLARKPF